MKEMEIEERNEKENIRREALRQNDVTTYEEGEN